MMQSFMSKARESSGSRSLEQRDDSVSAQFVDNRASTVAQCNLVDAINGSPKQVAQRQQTMEDEVQMKQAVFVNDAAGLENEADVEGGKALQMKSYNSPVTVSEVITSTDLNDWGIVRRKLSGITKGGSADSTIAGDVNSSLSALGLATGNSSMSAHMIPNRIGGIGDDNNVRPWDRAFETGTWETDVEQKFNQKLVGVKVGEKVGYSVTTSEMSDDQAQVIIDKSTVDADEKLKPEHKASIKKIPLDVSANVGGDALGKTDECYKNLIK